jgi:hypothetical protein
MYFIEGLHTRIVLLDNKMVENLGLTLQEAEKRMGRMRKD